MIPDILLKPKLNFFLAFCVVFCSGTLRADDSAADAVRALTSELSSVRLDETDARLPAGRELPLTMAGIENFFAKPLTVPTVTSTWLDKLESVDTLSGALELARGILLPTASGPDRHNFSDSGLNSPFNTLPVPLQNALPALIDAFESAQPLLNKAVDSISPSTRQDFLEMNEWPDTKTGAIKEDISTERTLHRYAAMKKFNDKALLDAAALIFQAVEDALPVLSSQWDGPSRMRFSTRIGTVLISGTADDIYTDDDLKDVVLLIDAGGHNTYKGRPALACEKEIRVIIDLGTDVTVTAPPQTAGGAGTGAFGIGIFAAPTPRGVKNISTGSFSQGAGLGGVGALWLGGQQTCRPNALFKAPPPAAWGCCESIRRRNRRMSQRAAGKGLRSRAASDCFFIAAITPTSKADWSSRIRANRTDPSACAKAWASARARTPAAALGWR